MCYFYENLYISKFIKNDDINVYLNDVECLKFSNSEKEFCDLLFIIDECVDVVNNLKNNKFLGLDGILVEFYKCFWKIIGLFFYEVLLSIFDKQELFFLQWLVFIIFLFKKGDKNSFKNYRLLSLMNIDYKILVVVFVKKL